jgi:nucleotide-binding universal stress UspA family protein
MYQRILAPIDGSDVSNDAVVEASRLAQDQSAEPCLAHVVDLGLLYRAVASGVSIDRLAEILIENGRQDLAAAVALARPLGVKPQTVLLRSDGRHVSDEIVDEAKRWPADLIVMGTHGRAGLERLFLGSVAEGVARAAPVPVLLVRTSGGNQSADAIQPRQDNPNDDDLESSRDRNRNERAHDAEEGGADRNRQNDDDRGEVHRPTSDHG